MTDDFNLKSSRREARRASAHRQIPKHGRTLATIYVNAVLKRARNGKHRKKKRS